MLPYQGSKLLSFIQQKETIEKKEKKWASRVECRRIEIAKDFSKT